ncbi:hypothetical protein RvY_09623 [Ramazzottius varieornatus]|uniref:Uncharacterized protein n=1 Tax=Ramazzottius varieornatus TaxID=947166 RepID=A0A1D1VA17_RAMVA|nr:hypothetical protein RvY_09623 [Ramazzottius varieornatus]
MPSQHYTEEDRRRAEDAMQREEDALAHHHHMQGGAPKFTTHIDPKYTGTLEMLNRDQTSCDATGSRKACDPEFPADLDLPQVQPIPNPTLEKDYGWYLNNVKQKEDVTDYYISEVDKAMTKPYRLPPGNPMKRFTWGYTGWLPYTTEHVGYTRQDLSAVCLREMDDRMAEVDRFRCSPARTYPEKPRLQDSLERVLHGVPGYTGYKEGTNYRYGYTHAQEMKEVTEGRHPWLGRACIDYMNSTLKPQSIEVKEQIENQCQYPGVCNNIQS